MDAVTRRAIRERARDRCEYCQLPQTAASYVQFHIEHIIAKQHVVDDSLDNLCLACPDCNRHKGPNLTTLIPDGGITRLFHPRRDIWDQHFYFDGAIVKGKTAIGGATIRLLKMNSEERIFLRTEILGLGNS